MTDHNAKKMVVIPCRNEEDTIYELVRQAQQWADEVIVANDGSTDRTAERARTAEARVVDVPSTRRGMAAVYVTGLKEALARGGQFIAEMDAGGSHNPYDLVRFWHELELGADMATGCRFGLEGADYDGHWKRALLSWGGTKVINLRNGTHWHDATSGFIAYRASALVKILARPLESEGHFYQSEMRLRARALGLDMVEVPIVYKNSGSSLRWSSIREALRLAL